VNNGQAGRDLAAAVFDGKIDDVMAMIKRDSRLFTTEAVYDKNKFSERPKGQYGDLLTFAVSRCDLAMEKHLLDLGMPVNGVKVGDALTLALLADGPEMAELLLQRGASPDPQKLGGENAMTEITSFNHVGGVMMLLRHGLDVNWEDQFGDNHLQSALAMENYRIAELLIEKGSNPWRIGGGGALPAQYFTRPMVIENSPDNEARLRLLAKAETDASLKGFPWPPPNLKTVRKMVLMGKWPTKEMLAAGVPPVSPIVMAHMRERFSKEIEQ
jgi:ankyrin repeat protein